MPLDVRKQNEILEELGHGIGSTALHEVWPGSFPNGNRVFAKAEMSNPSGSHYDRVYFELFKKDIEELTVLRPDYLVEVSSGNAGASFAWFCHKLGFKCRVILPDGLPAGFIENIRRLNRNAEIDVSPYRKKYLQGAVHFLREELISAKLLSRRVYCPNHSRRKETLEGTKHIGDECAVQLKRTFGISQLHYFIAAVGNGATIIGSARPLKQRFGNLRVVAFETESAPIGFQVKYPDTPKKPCSPHKLYGTGAYGISFPFIHDSNYQFSRIVDEVRLIDEPRLERAKHLRFKMGYSVGLTSLVGLELALEIMNANVQCKGCNFLILFYDRGEKYDWLE